MLHYEKDVCDMNLEEAERAYAHAIRNVGVQEASNIEADPKERRDDSEHTKLCKRLQRRILRLKSQDT